MREANDGGGNEGPTADFDCTAGAGSDDEGTCSQDRVEEACQRGRDAVEAEQSSARGTLRASF